MNLKNIKRVIAEQILNLQTKKYLMEQNPVTGQNFGAAADAQQSKVRGAEYWAQHPAELAKRLGISQDDVAEHLAFWQAELEAEGCSVDLSKTGAPEPTPRRR